MTIRNQYKWILVVSLLLLLELPSTIGKQSLLKGATALRRRALKDNGNQGKNNKDNGKVEQGFSADEEPLAMASIEEEEEDLPASLEMEEANGKGDKGSDGSEDDKEDDESVEASSSEDSAKKGSSKSQKASKTKKSKKSKDKSKSKVDKLKKVSKLSKTKSNKSDKLTASASTDEAYLATPKASGDELMAPDSEDQIMASPAPSQAPEPVTGSPSVAATDPPVDPTEPAATDAPVPPVETTDVPEPLPVITASPTVSEAVETMEPTSAPVETGIPTMGIVETEMPTAGVTEVSTSLPTAGATTSSPTAGATAAATSSPTAGATEAVPPPTEPSEPEVSDPPLVEQTLPNQVAAPTSSPTPSPTTEAPTGMPTTSPTPGATTEAPTVPTCPTDIQVNGQLEFSFVFADREPTDTEIESVLDVTLSFFVDLFREEFGDEVVEISGGVISSEFDFGPPPVFEMTFEAVVPFSECAPPLEEVDALLELSDAQYDRLLGEYIFPMEPAGQHIFVLAARVEFDGSASYVDP